MAAERPTGQVTFQSIRGCPYRAHQWMLTWCSLGSMSSLFGLDTHAFGTCIHGLSQSGVELSQPHFNFNLVYFQPPFSFGGLSELHASWKLEGTGGGLSVQVLKSRACRVSQPTGMNNGVSFLPAGKVPKCSPIFIKKMAWGSGSPNYRSVLISFISYNCHICS